jgi:hypothetical protein
MATTNTNIDMAVATDNYEDVSDLRPPRIEENQ